jgi:hypothetical protein
MKKKIIDLEIIDDLEQSGVAEIALVDVPAIEKYWMAFKDEEFVEPSAGESEEEFLGRCIPAMLDEGKDQDQAVAMCYSMYQNMSYDTGALPVYVDEIGDNKKEKFADTYTDYPDAAVENAKRALAYAEENGWGDCGMGPGKARANQLANREPISEDTIARMSAFERHRQNSETPYGEGCGKLMWDAWGGDAGVEWAARKLKEIRGEKFEAQGIILPRGEKVVLQAEDQNYDRGLVVELMYNGGYNVQYWYDSPDNIEPVEVQVDGQKITDAGSLVYLGYHPELEKFAASPIQRIPKEERGREGSAKNKEGDTKTSRGGIEVSEEVEKTLKDKIEEHNKKNPQDSQKADLGMLKAVWRRGAGAYSVGTPGRKGMTRPQWSMGRVNAFLKILSGSAPSDKDYTQDNDLLPKSHPKHSEAKKEDMSLALAYFRALDGLMEEDITSSGMRFDAESESMDMEFAAGYTVYRYEGSVDSDTRDFCREMVSDGRFFTFEEIVGFNSNNPGFGPGGSDEYSIFHYKGGPNCKHHWQKYYVNAEGVRENKGPAPGKAGTEPIDMPNQGYMMSKVLFASEDQQIVVGPVAIPDMEIPRIDPDTKEKYYVRFSKDVVQRMAEKFMKELRNRDTNIQHNTEDRAGSYVMETWLVENQEDKANSLYNLDVPIGSWVVKMRVEDPATWRMIKAGELRGFSLEGSFMDKKDWDEYQKDREVYKRVIKILKSS